MLSDNGTQSCKRSGTGKSRILRSNSRITLYGGFFDPKAVAITVCTSVVYRQTHEWTVFQSEKGTRNEQVYVHPASRLDSSAVRVASLGMGQSTYCGVIIGGRPNSKLCRKSDQSMGTNRPPKATTYLPQIYSEELPEGPTPSLSQIVAKTPPGWIQFFAHI